MPFTLRLLRRQTWLLSQIPIQAIIGQLWTTLLKASDRWSGQQKYLILQLRNCTLHVRDSSSPSTQPDVASDIRTSASLLTAPDDINSESSDASRKRLQQARRKFHRNSLSNDWKTVQSPAVYTLLWPHPVHLKNHSHRDPNQNHLRKWLTLGLQRQHCHRGCAATYWPRTLCLLSARLWC